MTYRIYIKNYEGNRKPAYPLTTRYSEIAEARKRAIKELERPEGKWYYAKVFEIGTYFGEDKFMGEVHIHAIDGPRWYPASGQKYTNGKSKLNRDGTIRYRIE